MQTLLFEVQPKPGHEDHYFQHAAKLKPILAKHEGLLFLDRYRSLENPNVILSHSRWKDEAAIARWRTDPVHHNSQMAGRNKHFQDYRIRISQALTHTHKEAGINQFQNSNGYRCQSDEEANFLAIILTTENTFEHGKSFHSVNNPGTYLSIVEAETLEGANNIIRTAKAYPNFSEALTNRVSRDYTLFKRADAPQYMPEVTG